MYEKQKHINAYELWFERMVKGYSPTDAVEWVAQQNNVALRTVWKWYSAFDWKRRSDERLESIRKTKEESVNSGYVKNDEKISLLLEVQDKLYEIEHYLKDTIKQTTFRGSGEYNRFVSVVRNRDRVCKCCGSPENLDVHHMLPFNLYNSLGVDVSNGIVLCESCHVKYHQIYGWNKNCNPITLMKFFNDYPNESIEVSSSVEIGLDVFNEI